MTTTNSLITVFPKRLHGLRVLLVEPDKNSLKHHSYMLLKNSYRVTTTKKASTGLAVITNGNIFDCVLVDAENLDMDLVHFLHEISKHEPHLPIIVIAWNDFQVRIVKDTLANEAIWFLQKPCEVSQICNILQHVCSKRIQFEEGTSTRKSLEEKQGHNNVPGVDTLSMPSAIHNTTIINDIISSSNGTHRGLNVKSHEYGAMSKPVNYVDISSDNDEPTIKENICTGRAKNIDKGKRPMELKRKNDQRVEDDIYLKNKIEIKTEIPWTTALNGKFLEISNALRKKNAHQKEIPILKQINLLGFTRDHVASNHVAIDHVASHLQIFQERKNNIKKPSVVAPNQKANNLQVANYTCNRFGISTNDATITQCNSLPRPVTLNSTGLSCMTLDSIKAKLQGANGHSFGYRFQPLIGETSMSSACGLVRNSHSGTGQGSATKITGHSYWNGIQPLVTSEILSNNTFGEATLALGFGETEESGFNLVEDVNSFSNCFANGNYGGSGVSETLASFDRFGIEVEPLVTTGGVVATSLDQGRLEDFTFPEFTSSDLGGVSHLQDFEGNGKNLFDVEDSRNLSFSNSDLVTFGHESDNYSLPSIPGEENNSIVPFDGSEGRVIDNDWFLGMIHPESY